MSLLCTFFERDKNSNLKWVLFLSVDAQETSIKYGILKAWTHNHDRKTAYFSLQNCDPYISLNGKVSTLGFQAFQSNTFEKNQQTKTPPMTIERTIWRCLLGHCGVNWDLIRIYAMLKKPKEVLCRWATVYAPISIELKYLNYEWMGLFHPLANLKWYYWSLSAAELNYTHIINCRGICCRRNFPPSTCRVRFSSWCNVAAAGANAVLVYMRIIVCWNQIMQTL